jgi:hypothetical protein
VQEERELSERLRLAQKRAEERLARELSAACGAEREWPAKLAAGVHAAIGFASRSPDEARLLLLDAIASDRALAAGARAASERFTELLRHGREQGGAAALPDLTEQALVGAATSIIGARVMAERASSLDEVEVPLTELMLTPYVGAEEAQRLALEIGAGSP